MHRLLITVKDAGNYASKPTRRQKAYETIIHFTRHFARRPLILKLVIHRHNTRFMLSLSGQVRQRVLFSTPDSSSCLRSATAWALARRRCSLQTATATTTEMTGSRSTAATTSTAPHTAAADADACTTCEICFVAPCEGCALLWVQRKPRCCYEHIFLCLSMCVS